MLDEHVVIATDPAAALPEPTAKPLWFLFPGYRVRHVLNGVTFLIDLNRKLCILGQSVFVPSSERVENSALYHQISSWQRADAKKQPPARLHNPLITDPLDVNHSGQEVLAPVDGSKRPNHCANLVVRSELSSQISKGAPFRSVIGVVYRDVMEPSHLQAVVQNG